MEVTTMTKEQMRLLINRAKQAFPEGLMVKKIEDSFNRTGLLHESHIILLNNLIGSTVTVDQVVSKGDLPEERQEEEISDGTLTDRQLDDMILSIRNLASFINTKKDSTNAQ